MPTSPGIRNPTLSTSIPERVDVVAAISRHGPSYFSAMRDAGCNSERSSWSFPGSTTFAARLDGEDRGAEPFERAQYIRTVSETAPPKINLRASGGLGHGERVCPVARIRVRAAEPSALGTMPMGPPHFRHAAHDAAPSAPPRAFP